MMLIKLDPSDPSTGAEQVSQEELGGNSIGFLDRLTDRLKMRDGLKMSDFRLGMS